MPDSDWSDNEEVTMKHGQKKTKRKIEKNRKRGHSNSADDSEFGRVKKKKDKTKNDSENEIKDSEVSKSKYKKYRKKENEDSVVARSRKHENKYSFTHVDSDYDSGKDRYKKESKNKKSQEAKNSKTSYGVQQEKNKNSSRKTNLDEAVISHSGHKSRHESNSDSEIDERKHISLSNKQNKERDKNYTKSNYKKKKRNNEDNEVTSDHDETEKYHRTIRNKGKDKEETSICPEKDHFTSSREKNSDRRSKYDDLTSFERYDKRSFLSNEDEDDRETVNSEKPYRYWSSSRGPIRKNSDSYWNKYSERLKEPAEHVEVGPRYYGSGENSRKEKNVTDSNKDKQKNDTDNGKEIPKDVETPKQKKTIDLLTSKTGGAYIPPAKLRMMQESITDKASAAYQRLAWEALKKSIQGHVNKVNTANIKVILGAVVKENIVRGKGLLCRALIQAQAASPSFTNVYAAFIAVLNAKFPKIGELLLKRLVVQFRRGFKRNDKTICITAATFIAHLVNQEVAHEIIALEILTLLIETPTDDSVEVAIAFLKECGMKLTEVSNKGVQAIFDMLRNILHEGKLEKRVQYMIEVMFQVRKEEFKAHPSLIPELNLVDDEDRIQHMITLEENHDPEDILNVFKFDPDYEANEAKYKSLNPEDDSDESEGGDGSGSSGSDDESEEEEEGVQKDNGVIVDKTETNLVALRKTIYLTIQSSLDFEECAHKLLRMELKPGQEIEMAHMFLDCCAEQRTYEKFYGLLAQRFCQINRTYVGPFEETFRDSYATIHRMSNDKLRNVGKLFAHLLYTDAISWDVLATIRLNEDDTTSSSRIFIKILFLELSEYMGLAKLNQRVKDPSLHSALEGLFPRDNPKHTRFAINFFTSIGLGGLTDELREHLKAQPKQSIVVPQLVEGLSSSSSSSDSSSDSSDSSDSSSDSSSSESSSSQSEDSSNKKKTKRKSVTKNKNKPVKTTEKAKSSKKKKTSPPKRKRDR